MKFDIFYLTRKHKRNKTNIQSNKKDMCQKIHDLNRKTAKDLLIATGQYGIFPVDIAQICFKLGIRLREFDFTNIEAEKVSDEVAQKGNILGAVVARGNDLAILYDIKNTSNRRRFTIAHEIAHICLDMDPHESFHIEYRRDSISNDSKEQKANIFAGELLIPTNMLTSLIGDSKYISNDLVPPLCELFMVSENVLRARLKHLKITVLT